MIKTILVSLLLVSSLSAASPAKCYAVTSSANWNTPSIWSSTSGGAGGTCTASGGSGVTVIGNTATLSAGVPGASGASDVAVINTGVTVHIPSGIGVDLGSKTYGTAGGDSITVNGSNSGALVVDAGGLLQVNGASSTGYNWGVINGTMQNMPGGYIQFGAYTNGPNLNVNGQFFSGCLDQTVYPSPFCSSNSGAWATATVAPTLNITFATTTPQGLAVGAPVMINVPQGASSATDTVPPPTPPLMPRTNDTGTSPMKTCGSAATCVIPESTVLCVVAVSGSQISVGWPQGGTTADPYCTGAETAINITNAGLGPLWVNIPAFIRRAPSILSWNNSGSFSPSSRAEHFDPTRTTLPIASGIVISNAAGTGPGRYGDSSINVSANNWGASNSGTPCTFLSIADVTSSGCYMDYDRGLMVSYGFATSYTGAMTYKALSSSTPTVAGNITIPSGSRTYNQMVIGNTLLTGLMKDYSDSFFNFQTIDNTATKKAAFMFNAVRYCNGLVGIGSNAVNGNNGFNANASYPLQINYNSVFPNPDTLSVDEGNINFWGTSSNIDVSNNYFKLQRAEITSKNQSASARAYYSGVTITNNNVLGDGPFVGQTGGAATGQWPGLVISDNRVTGTGQADGSFQPYIFAFAGTANDNPGTPAIFRRNIIFSTYRAIHSTGGFQYTKNAFVQNWHHTIVMGTQSSYNGGVMANNSWDHNVFVSANESQGLDGFDSGFAESGLIDGLTMTNNTWLGHTTCFRIGDTDLESFLLLNISAYNNVCAPQASTGAAFGKGGAVGSAQQNQLAYFGNNGFQGASITYASNLSSSNALNYQYNQDVLVTNANGNYNTDSTRNVKGVMLQNSVYTNNVTGGKLKLVVTSLSNMTLAWSSDGVTYGTAVQVNWTTAGTTYTTSSASTLGATYEFFTTSVNTTPWTQWYPKGGLGGGTRPVGCPATFWAMYTSGANSGKPYLITQCQDTSTLTMVPNYSSAPAAADTFAVLLPEVRLYDAGGTNYVDAGIDARSIPQTPGTYIDSGISLTQSDLCASGCGSGVALSGLPISYTTGVSGSPLYVEPLPMYGGSAQHLFQYSGYVPTGTGWQKAGVGGTYIGAIAPVSPTTPTGIVP